VAITGAFQAKAYISNIATVTYDATTTIDMSAGDLQYLNLIGDTDIQLSNIVEGKSLLVRIDSDGTERFITFPIDWKWFPNGNVPTSLVANSTALLAIASWSNLDTGIVASWTS
jgi:hypothetical protein